MNRFLHKIIGLIVFSIIITGCQNSKIDWYEYYVKVENGVLIDNPELIDGGLYSSDLNRASVHIDLMEYQYAEKVLLSLIQNQETQENIKLDATLKLLRIYYLEDRKHEWQESIFENIDNIDWSQLSRIEFYHNIYILLHKSNYLCRISKFEESLAAIDYGLHLMHINTLNQDFPRLKSKLLGAKAIVFISHSFDYNLPAKDLLLQAIQMAQEAGDMELYYKHKANLATAYLQLKDTITAENTLAVIKNNIENTKPINQYIHYTNQGYLSLEKGNAQEAITNFKMALTNFDERKCVLYKHLLNLYISDAFLIQGALDSSEYYLHFATQLNECNTQIADKIKYYSQWTKNDIYRHRYIYTEDISWIDSSLLAILDERNLSLKLFNDKQSLHLDEYYAENLSRFLTTLYGHPTLYNKYMTTVINLFEDTKKRAIKINERIEKKYDNRSRQLESLLQKINDHKKNNNYADKTYEEIYNYFLSETGTQSKKLNKTNIDHTVISKKLLSNKKQIINCIDYSDITWCYSVSHNCFEIDSLNSLYKKIIPEFNSCLQTNNIIFIGDGKTENTSIELHLPNAKIEYAYSLHQYLQNSNINLSTYDINILSYTSENTHKSLIKKSYTELYNGYQECESIHQLFPESRLYAGIQTKKEAVASVMSSDILHISTHAYSDTLKRHESYLILRDSLGNPTRLYADEILSMPTVPKFVNLSACQTGTGVHMAGAGTYSIARSFLQKGSEAVMKTLWDVDDQATKEFMILFYTKWNEGMSCGEALRKTKQDFKSSDKYSAPKFWAGFILEGNPNLYISKN